jgi:periplasmic protein TonB
MLPIPTKEYALQVSKHLMKFRRYPAGPRVLEGRVVVFLVIARDGNLLESRIAQSSGYATIDAAELETVKRAIPFPTFPPEMAQDKTAFLSPVTYRIGPRK